MMIRVVAVDDHSSTLAGLKALIAEYPDMQLVGTANHGSKLPDLLREHHPDVATLDLGMKTGKFDPVDTVREAKKEFPEVKILIFTNYDDGALVRELTEAGASGYMLKSDDFSLHMGQAIYAVYDGGLFYSPQIAGEVIGHKDQVKLTPREWSILRLLDKGASTKMMAKTLFVSVKRISNVVTILCRKLEVHEDNEISLRYAIVQKARALGLLPNLAMDANIIELLSRREEDDDLA